MTDSMVHTHSCEANGFSANEEISRNVWNLKVHYGILKSQPPVLSLS